ncbi:MAG: DDE-type integrase/transposase/recombinase [Rhodobacteraceae bacterium]|nr:DDE-type integrase/transposase/recombinase [Paracoccaceae bacterium]
MNQHNHTSYMPFTAGESDLLRIQGQAWRPESVRGGELILAPVDRNGLREAFDFGTLRRLNAAGEIEHIPGYFLPEDQRIAQRHQSFREFSSSLSLEGWKRLWVKLAFVRAFDHLYDLKQIKKTELSIGASLLALEQLAERYFLQELPTGAQMEREAAQADAEAAGEALKTRRKRGGRQETRLSAPAARTLLGWVRDYKKYGLAGLCDEYAKCGNNNTYFTSDERFLLTQTVREGYLVLGGATKTHVKNTVRLAFLKANEERAAEGRSLLRVPGKRAVNREIDAIPHVEVLVAHFGKDAAMNRLRTIGAGVETSRPFERGEADEWKIDLFSHLDPDAFREIFGEKIYKDVGFETGNVGRWWLSAVIDHRTKLIVGATLTRSPRGSAALKSLRMSMSDRGYLARAVGAKTPWDQCATWEEIVTDAGAAYTSIVFVRACEALGITKVVAKAGAATMRGAIERCFGSAARGVLRELHGRTFEDVIAKDGYPSMERACLSVEDVARIFLRWVIDMYHNTPHEALGGRTPLEQWEADMTAGNSTLNGAPGKRKKRMAFGLAVFRKLHKGGLTVLGVQYQDPCLEKAYLDKRGQMLEIRWDPDDISVIEVNLGGWIEVEAVKPAFANGGVCAEDWIETRKALRTRSPQRQKWTDDVVMAALDDILSLNRRKGLAFQILDRNWSEDRLTSFELEEFQGFSMSQAAPTLGEPDGGRGQVILPQRPGHDLEGVPEPSAPEGDAQTQNDASEQSGEARPRNRRSSAEFNFPSRDK